MSLGSLHRGKRFRRELTARNYGAWILCALLLVLCANARLARYDIHQRTQKLATTQAYLDGAETLRKLPRTATLVPGQVVAPAIFVVTTLHTVLLTAVLPKAAPFKGFSAEFCLRPPPVR